MSCSIRTLDSRLPIQKVRFTEKVLARPSEKCAAHVPCSPIISLEQSLTATQECFLFKRGAALFLLSVPIFKKWMPSFFCGNVRLKSGAVITREGVAIFFLSLPSSYHCLWHGKKFLASALQIFLASSKRTVLSEAGKDVLLNQRCSTLCSQQMQEEL